MKKRIVLCLLVLALLSVTGCTQKKDAEPLTVTLWHVYGGEVDSPLNDLIERFNSTVGAKQNIRVKVELVSNSGSIHKSVLAAASTLLWMLPLLLTSSTFTRMFCFAPTVLLNRLIRPFSGESTSPP